MGSANEPHLTVDGAHNTERSDGPKPHGLAKALSHQRQRRTLHPLVPVVRYVVALSARQHRIQLSLPGEYRMGK